MNLLRSSKSLRAYHGFPALVAALLGIAILGSTRIAEASPCLQDAANDTGLSCSSNDVSVASVDITVLTDGCDFPGDTFTFDANLNVMTNANTRYDIGFFIGASPLTSTNEDCLVTVIDPASLPNPQDGDVCGDVMGNALLPVTNLTAPCLDGNGDAQRVSERDEDRQFSPRALFAIMKSLESRTTLWGLSPRR